MAYSKITLEFIAMPSVDDFFNIEETSLGLMLNETFKEYRYGSHQVSLPVFIPAEEMFPDSYFGDIRTNYKNAFNLDYNSTGLFTVTTINGPEYSGLGTVVIEANFPGAVFSASSDYFVDVDIVNEVTFPAFNISGITFTPKTGEESSKCSINVTTNHLTTKLLQPSVINPNAVNPIVISAYRATTFNVEVEDVNGLRALQSVTTPSYLNISNFTFDIVNSPEGGTVNVSNINSDGLVLQYSLDNSTWQSATVFSGLVVGTYTIWIKDQLGHSISKSFSVTESGIYTPYFYISKSNSFRFANRVTWGDSANYKTDENTLSHEVDCEIPYTEIQQFQSADVITTQFKSNYSTNMAKIIKSDLSEVVIPVVKKSNNIGIKDKRDAFKCNMTDGKSGLFFQSGNTYDYNTGLVSGTYALNGDLPEWAVVDNYFAIGSAWFLIEEIVFDEVRNASVVVFTNTYTGADMLVVASSIFNRFIYEVYEFEIDMSDYIDQYFRVRIRNSDSRYGEIIHLSEQIWCKVKHENVLEIKYSNSSNTDIFYATGIVNLIRLPYTYFKGKFDEESEIHKTDTNSILLSADVYEVDEIVFEPVTKEIWRKMVLALSHENVTINGVGYVKNGNFNSEGPLERSNLYVLTATMIKTDNNLNGKMSTNSLGGFEGTFITTEDGVIETDGGYMTY